MNKLVLFDIDGTIIKGKHGHAKYNFLQACQAENKNVIINGKEV